MLVLGSYKDTENLDVYRVNAFIQRFQDFPLWLGHDTSMN